MSQCGDRGGAAIIEISGHRRLRLRRFGFDDGRRISERIISQMYWFFVDARSFYDFGRL